MSRWSGVSLICLQQVVRVGLLVEFGERHDKRAAQLFLERTCSLWQAERENRCENATMML